jgi:ATP-dependent RNA helicase SUPV3L1/SUV3
MGFSCSLHTGQEKLIKIDSTHVSCTIETVNLNIQYDVAIIDEIQMIGNEDRGNAWTQAFLGLDAKEIHICGDSRALDYISQLAKLTNDTVFCLFILLILQIEEV